MINCKMYRKDEDEVIFDVEIVGVSEDVLIEMMKINSVLIKKFRDCGIPEEEIREQLIDCIAGGYELANRDLERNPKSP